MSPIPSSRIAGVLLDFIIRRAIYGIFIPYLQIVELKFSDVIVPMLCVGMQPGTLRVPKRTQSVHWGIPTQSVGTISQGKKRQP
ncbi:hypothetical protein VD17_18660 [Pseudomonas fluorescens]|uniref:Uncharacterized protein n=1 Tax=Pseudomonas fluorescens TaxID=294 RepID=A0A0F4V8Q9_PSEFL|nr:hypothetical protein VD17_18660 [Pseudomonas fluorescens]